MKQKKKTTKRIARVMVDPHPNFVSLVRHGANQTPFKTVKNVEQRDMEEIENNVSAKEADDSMGDVGVISRVEFPVDRFSKKSAAEWLDAKGFAGYEIETSGDNLVVKNSLVESPEKETPVEMDGVTVYLADWRSADAEGGEEQKTYLFVTQPVRERKRNEHDLTIAEFLRAKKTEENAERIGAMENALKHNEFMAEFSDGKTLAEVMADGDDGLPVGIWEVSRSMITALRNAFEADDLSAVKTISEQYAEAVTYLYHLKKQNFMKVENTEPEGTEKMDKAKQDQALLDGDQKTDERVNKNTAEQGGENANAQPGGENPQQVAGKHETADEARGGEASEPVSKADFEKLSGDISEAVKAMTEGVESAKTELNEKIEKFDERLTDLENRAQTRKGADVEEIAGKGDSGEDREKARKWSERRLKDAFGRI